MAAPATRLSWQYELLDLRPSRPAPTLVPPPPPVEPGQSEALRQVRALLDPAIARRVRSGAELLRHVANTERTDVLPTTLEGIDKLLGGGLPRGRMIELVSRRAAGRFSVILSALAAATTMGEAAALIDLGDHFDPQLGEANGIDLRRLLWVRPRTVKEAVMAAEMITATGFQLVVVDVGLHPLRGKRAPDAAWVRLARSAEAHGAALLVSSPYPLTGTASEAVIKGSVARAKWLGTGRSPRLLERIDLQLSLEKHRHIKAGSYAKVSLLAPDADASRSLRVSESTSRRASLPVSESSSRREAISRETHSALSTQHSAPADRTQSLALTVPLGDSETRRLGDS